MLERFLPLFTILLIPVLSPALASGQDEKQVFDKDWVSERIQRLDADTLRERAMAERELLNAGPELLPLLPPPELLPSAAVRQAVRRIRLRLEEAKARDSVKASTVTIKGRLPVKEILKQIAAQTGNEIDASRLPAEILDRTIELEPGGVPFWDALIRLGEKAGFQLENSKLLEAASSGVRLIPAEPAKKAAAQTAKAAFLVEALSVKRRPIFGEDDKQLLRVPMRISAEPRLRPLFLKLEDKDFSARTPSDKMLSLYNPEAKLELPLGEGGHETAFHMDFLAPKPFREPTIELKGKATLTVAAGSEEIGFTNLPKAAGTARRRGGVTVTLNDITFQADENNPNPSDTSTKRKRVDPSDTNTKRKRVDPMQRESEARSLARRAGQKAKIRLTVHYDTGGPAFESHRTWIFYNQVYLEDADGKRFERNSDFETTLQTDGGVIVEYNFDDLPGDPADYKFIYVAPTLIINVPVEFEFEKLPGERDA